MSRTARTSTLSLRRGPAAFLALVLAATLSVLVGAPPAQADDSPFQVTMTPSSQTVASGDQLTYTVNVTNTGGDITQDTLLTSQISGMTGLILTSNVGTCTQTDNFVECSAGTMAGFQSWQITIRGTVTAANGTTLFNGVTVSANHESSGYQSSTNTSVLVSNAPTGQRPDLRVSVQGPGTIAPTGAPNVTYQLTVNNTGSANATDVTVINTMPDGFSYVGAGGNSLFSCTNLPVGSRTVVCTDGRVNAGSNATITITGTPGSYASGTSLRDTAVVDPYDFIAESSELNNTGSLVTVTGAQAVQTGLVIQSFDDAPDPLRTGDLLTYTAVIKNTSATRADNVSFTDITQGLDAASIVATTTHGVCTVTAPKVVCTRTKPTLRLEVNETMTVTITGRVTSPQHTLITNTATVTGVIKNRASTNTARTTTTIRPPVDLTIAQRARTNHTDPDSTQPSTDPFRAWDHFEYDVSVGNSGMDDAENVIVRQVVAPGVRYVKVDSVDTEPDGEIDAPGDITCDQSAPGEPIRCSIPLMQGTESSGSGFGTFSNFEIHVIAPPEPGTIAAVATVDPGNAVFEGDETNNSHMISTVIETGIDLTIQKASPSPVAPSGTLVYTITVSNVGTQDATGVKIRDVLPAGTRFRRVTEAIPSGETGHNFTCSHDGSATGGDVTCVGGRLRGTHDHSEPADFAVIELVVFAPADPGLIRNQVRVDPDDSIPELLETNNINTFYTDIQIGGVGAFHEFDLAKSQTSPADAKVSPSGVVEYDLVVRNTGSQVAFDVTVQDIMPTGFEFRHAEDTQQGVGDFECSVADRVITCAGGTLDGSDQQTAMAGDSTRTIHVSMFAATQPGTYKNKAVVDPDNTHPEANETNNSAEFDTTVVLGGGGDFIELTVDSRQTQPAGDVVPSGALQYTLDVKNTGSAVAFNVKVKDTLPAGSVFRDATDSQPGAGAFECTESGGVVTCTGGTLDRADPGDTALAGDDVRHIVINVFAPPEPGDYVNTAMVDPDNAINEANETDNADTTTTAVRLGGGGNYRDLVATSVVPSPTEPEPGKEYTYVVTVQNSGTNPAYNLVLRNTLDDAATFVKAVGQNGFTCSVGGNLLTCDGGTLDGSSDLDPTFDSDATVTITARAPRRHDFAYGMQSRIDPANAIPESNEGNNQAAADVTVKSKIDLEPEVSVSGGQGSEGSVSFSVDNNGSSLAEDAVLVVEMPVGVIPQNLGTVAEGWTCSTSENPINQVRCHGDLAGGATASFEFTTYVTAETITANIYADPDEAIVESDETNNAAHS